MAVRLHSGYNASAMVLRIAVKRLKGRAGIVAVGIMLVCPVGLCPAQNAPDERSTFTKNTELVMVPVQVLDRSGRPLHGLKQNNFVVKSDGKPQAISVFDEVQAPPATPNSSPVLVKAAATTDTQFSNAGPHGFPPQLVIMAIDTINTPFQLQGWARDQLMKYLNAKPLEQPVEIVALTPDGIRRVHAATTDNAALVKSVRSIHEALTRHDSQPALLTWLDRSGTVGSYSSYLSQLQANQATQARYAADAGILTLRNFEEIAWAYSGIPGRKTVLWFSTGFPVEQEVPDRPSLIGRGPARSGLVAYSSGLHVSDQLLLPFHRAFTALNNANVVVYPVDVNGLPEDVLWDISMPDSLFIHHGRSVFAPPFFANTAAEDRDGMRELAQRTGGKTCDANNNIRNCVDRALTESSDYYLLGFYIEQQARKTGWHKLKVAVDVDHGEVRARSNYFLRPPGAPPQIEQIADLQSAVNANVEYTGIVFRVRVGAPPPSGSGPLTFRVEMPASSIVTVPDQKTLSFDVVAVPVSARGTLLLNSSRIVKLTMPESAIQKALSTGWNLIDTVETNSSTAAVKVVVRDNDTRRVGTVVFPVSQRNEIPQLLRRP